MNEAKNPEIRQDEGSCKHVKADAQSHPCPFAEEIRDIHDDYCNCCDDCAHECAMDV